MMVAEDTKTTEVTEVTEVGTNVATSYGTSEPDVRGTLIKTETTPICENKCGNVGAMLYWSYSFITYMAVLVGTIIYLTYSYTIILDGQLNNITVDTYTTKVVAAVRHTREINGITSTVTIAALMVLAYVVVGLYVDIKGYQKSSKATYPCDVCFKLMPITGFFATCFSLIWSGVWLSNSATEYTGDNKVFVYENGWEDWDSNRWSGSSCGDTYKHVVYDGNMTSSVCKIIYTTDSTNGYISACCGTIESTNESLYQVYFWVLIGCMIYSSVSILLIGIDTIVSFVRSIYISTW